jgi:hypothetical protein
LFKPGVYWDDRTRRDIDEMRTPKFKARGFAAADFANQIREMDRAFSEWNAVDNDIPIHNRLVQIWPEVEFTAGFAMVSCLQAIRRNDWSLAGSVSQNEPMTQNANPARKRVPVGIYDIERSIWRTPLWKEGADLESMPYLKRFGMDDPWSLENEDEFINPDGPIMLLMKESLGING